MRADFKFYNVGQGCFYGGAIKHNKTNFVVVYDCGSVTKGKPLKPAINEFKQKFSHIDLLIISHFDQDHVNGIEELIKGIRVERIIMPYMPLWYRILLIAKTSGDIDNYSSMLLNPTTYFLQGDFTVGKVYYIDQSFNEEISKESEPNNDPKFDRELDPNEEIGELILIEPLEDEGVKQRILGEEQEQELNDKDAYFLQSDAIFGLENSLWEFLFYHKETKQQTDITDFQNAVQNYMSIKGILKLGDLFTGNHNRVIHKIYKDHINNDINYSSLCVYHGPLFKTKVWGSEENVLKKTYKMVFSLCYFYAAGNTLKSGTLLTGDQFLKKSRDFDPFYNYYRTRLDRTLVFQVPHHGSFNNWQMMPNKLNRHFIKCFIINHGYGRKKHPNKKVLLNILKFANPLILNDEFTYFQYGIIPFK
jgi:hypothetical protein